MSRNGAEPIFKLIDSSHVASFMAGRVLVHSLAYFAELEFASGVAGIGDQFEAGPRVEIKDLDASRATDDELITLDEFGCRIAPGAQVIMSNATFYRSAPHSHLLCFTLGDLATQAAQFPYDAAIEVFDIEGLASAIFTEGVLDCDGRPPVRQAFRSVKVGPVTYDAKLGDLSSPSVLGADAFVKPITFQDQREMRILLLAVDEEIHDRVLIEIPGMDRFARPVRHPGPKALAGPDFEPVGGRQEIPFADELHLLVRDVSIFENVTRAKSTEFTAARSAAFDRALRERGSAAAAAADPVLRAASEIIWHEMTAYHHTRAEEFQRLFEGRIRRTKWRARLHERLRPIGMFADAHNKRSLDFLRERAAGALHGPAGHYYRQTRFAFDL